MVKPRPSTAGLAVLHILDGLLAARQKVPNTAGVKKAAMTVAS
jgi:hypothetical protein